jgi:hypothetical protein
MIPEIYCKDKIFWTEVRTRNSFLKVPQETTAHTKPQPSKNMKKTIQLLVALSLAIGFCGDFSAARWPGTEDGTRVAMGNFTVNLFLSCFFN